MGSWWIERELVRWLKRLERRMDRTSAPHYVLAGWLWRVHDEMEVQMGEVTVEVGAGPQQASVVFLDAEGNEVAPDETPEWSSSDESVATVVAAEDGLSAIVSFVAEGSAVIEVATTETAPGDVQTEIRATGLVNVADVDAVVAEITFEPLPTPPSELGPPAPPQE